MRKFLWVLTIAVSVTGALISLSGILPANGVAQPAGSPAAAPPECDCKNLKALQIELRNAIRLQQAFQGKIADLRKLDQVQAYTEFKKFADAAANGLNRPVGDTGPKAVDYTPYGDSVDTGILEKERETPARHEELCGLSRNAKMEMYDMESGASCAGIVQAVVAHEGVHWASCRRSGYVAFRDMHGADRAQEEVEAYGAQIKVLRDIIARLRCGYRATGQTADVVYSGVICSLEESFTVTGTSSLNAYPFKFFPESATTGRVSFNAAAPGISMEGSGSYKIEGADSGKPRIAVTMGSVGHTVVGSRSGGGTVYIDLVPLEHGECQVSQPR